jgi:hypothetical protein
MTRRPGPWLHRPLGPSLGYSAHLREALSAQCGSFVHPWLALPYRLAWALGLLAHYPVLCDEVL